MRISRIVRSSASRRDCLMRSGMLRLPRHSLSTGRSSTTGAAGAHSHQPGSIDGSGDASSFSSAARGRLGAVGQAFRDYETAALRAMLQDTLNTRSQKMALRVAAAALALGTFIFVYRNETKKAVVEELSDVATRSLSDEKMQAQAAHVSIQTLQALLEHGETVQRSVTFLSAVAEHEQTRTALIALLVQALKSPAVLEEALNLVLWILDNEQGGDAFLRACGRAGARYCFCCAPSRVLARVHAPRSLLAFMLVWVLSRRVSRICPCAPHVLGAARENVASCLIASLQNARFQEAAAEFAVRWLAHEDVRTAVSSVFKEASLQVTLPR